MQVGQRDLVAAATEEYSCEFGSQKYFALCAFGGVLSCGITHTAVTPLDLVKCRLQVDKEKYKSIGNGFKVTLAEGGAKGLVLGWAPTAIGYSAQGLCKFGFYEVFKKIYSDMIGEENTYLYRTSLYLASSASAEFFADIALSPMEACKVPLSRRHIDYRIMDYYYSGQNANLSCWNLPNHLEGSISKDNEGRGGQWFLQVACASLVQTDPLHHDEVRLLREDRGGHLPVRGAQAPS